MNGKQTKKYDNTGRIFAIAIIYIAISLIFIGRLLYLQVSGQDYYTMSTPTTYYTRTVTVQAQRGGIYDRNGKALVTNKYEYSVSLDYSTLPDTEEEINDLILDVSAAAVKYGEEDKITSPRTSIDVSVGSGGLLFYVDDDFLDTVRGKRYVKLVEELNADAENDEEAGEALMLYYGITSEEKNADTGEYEVYYNYPYSTAAELLLRRLDMSLSGFSSVEPYELAADVSVEFITQIEEAHMRGFVITAEATRVYSYPGYLSHILGRTGKIQSGKEEYYTSLGYQLDAIVGTSGAEYSFEEYLHGTDGTMEITEDAYGNIVSTEMIEEPIAGKNVYLTVNIDMQIIAENALAENIFRIRAEANPYKALTGEDACAGALTVLDVNNNQILAIASYPTYNLATFNEDYENLYNDELSPMFNRALNGTYAPGSTFKVGVAVAALSEGTITKDTIIDTKGIYTYYEDSGYTPRCWLYLLSGEMHGPINVVEAIQESCNYFFFDVGRQLTIEKMNEYCKHYGLGQATGIELIESTGILAGPEYRENNGMGQWSPGDTLQAAIGQSDNLFTPLQLGCYLSTILNYGTRYAAHILYKVCDYATGETVYSVQTEVLDSITISDETYSTVMEGMKGVMDNGSAASVFSDYEIPVGGKTGTAQVYSNRSDNGVMIAFAPFDSPEIVASCVIESASGGTETGYSIRDIFDYYFEVDRTASAEDEDEDGDESSDETDGEYSDDYSDDYSEDYSEDYYDDYSDDYSEDYYYDEYDYDYEW